MMKAKSSKKMFFVMIGVLSLMAILLVAGVILGDLFLQKQAAKLTSLKLDDQVIEAQQTALVQAKKDLQTYSELESIANQVVPQDKDQAKAVREIVSLANQSGISIGSISFPASTLGQAAPKAATPTDGSTPAPAVTTPSVTQVKPVDGIKNLFQLDITIVSDTTKPVTYAKLIDFLSRLEQNRRTSQVSQISIQPDSQNRAGLNFTLTITVYIKP